MPLPRILDPLQGKPQVLGMAGEEGEGGEGKVITEPIT